MLPEICITITWTRNVFQIVGAAGRESTCANCGFTGFLNCFSSWIGGQFFIYFWLKCWKQRKKNLKMLKYTRRDFCMRFQREKNYGDFAKAQDSSLLPYCVIRKCPGYENCPESQTKNCYYSGVWIVDIIPLETGICSFRADVSLRAMAF